MKKLLLTLLALTFLNGIFYAQNLSDSLGNQYVKLLREIYLLEDKFHSTSDEQEQLLITNQIKVKEGNLLLLETTWREELCRDQIRAILGGESAKYDDCKLIEEFLVQLTKEINDGQGFCLSIIKGGCNGLFRKTAEEGKCENIIEDLNKLMLIIQEQEEILDNEWVEKVEIYNSGNDNEIILDDDLSVSSDEVESIVFIMVEQKASFPGGDAALMEFIATNTKYPEIAKENQIQGTVYIKFTVDQNGHVTNIYVAKGVDPNLDAEAIRVVKMFPDFIPAMQKGKPVSVELTIPIGFGLYNNEVE